jgi:hypothetical protein
MTSGTSLYMKQTGISIKDKDLFIIQEIPDPAKFINLQTLIQQNGGLIRLPSLLKTGALNRLIKLWGGQLLNIIQTVQKHGCCLGILRAENFYLNVETNEILLHTLRGVGKYNQNG